MITPRFIGPFKTQQRFVYAILGLYAAGFVIWWPNALMVLDEARYVGQAVLFSQGRVAVEQMDSCARELEVSPVSTYPPGTSLLQAPFVAIGGWRAAPLLSLFSAILMVLFLMRWLREEGHSPLFALLALAYPPLAVMGRIGMSDVPSGFIVTLGWFLFWRGARGSRAAWLGSGFLAGASFTFRESNPLLFVPLFLGAVLRRERRVWQLVVGGAAGMSTRFIAAHYVFSEAFFTRTTGDFWQFPKQPIETALLYGFALLVMLPGGLIGLMTYRGERRPEVIVTGLLYAACYCFFYYSGSESGLAMRLILGPRFFIPLLPVLVWAMAESLPRLARPLESLLLARPRFVNVILILGVAVLIVEMVIPHIVLYRWGTVQAHVRDVIYSKTSPGSLVVADLESIGKQMSYAYGRRSFVPLDCATSEHLARWSAGNEPVFYVFLTRNDAPYRDKQAELLAHAEQAYRENCDVELLHDEQVSGLEHLRIGKVTNCRTPIALGLPIHLREAVN